MKGILFKTDMIQAIIDGRKTVTRRLGRLKEINKEPDKWRVISHIQADGTWLFFTSLDRETASAEEERFIKPRYRVGEIIYIKEAWATENKHNHLPPREIPRTARIFYLLNEPYDPFTIGRKRSPMFMMEWMARLFTKINNVRPRRLQEITEEDALKEVILLKAAVCSDNQISEPTYRDSYIMLWDSINPKHPFSLNEWVFRIGFKLVKKGESQEAIIE